MEQNFPTETAGSEFQIEYRVEAASPTERFAASFLGNKALGLNSIESVPPGMAELGNWSDTTLATGKIENGTTEIRYRSEINPYHDTKVFNHEAGHGLGLMHSEDPNNLMFRTTGRTGDELTVEQLRQITTHDANTVTTCSSESSDAGLC